MKRVLHYLFNANFFFRKGFKCKNQNQFHTRVSLLVGEFTKAFENRDDTLASSDFEPYRYICSNWNELFSYYDFLIAYSTDPILPMLCARQYFAFEHGTIRSIPYQVSSVGRATALAYRMADHVFVTNADCVASAEYLNPGCYTLINHPFDEDHGLSIKGSQELRMQMCAKLECDMLFFFPTRQDWVSGTGYADKGNDIFIKAFASLRRSGIAAGLVCCEWGANVSQSKALIEDLGCSRFVYWIKPLAIIAFERMARAAHCVVDQFVLGAFGGIVFKAMAVGAPILTYLDETQMTEQYPECPPVLNCQNTEQIFNKINYFSEHRDELAEIGKASRAWIKKYHSKDRTVNNQVDQFRKMTSMPQER